MSKAKPTTVNRYQIGPWELDTLKLELRTATAVRPIRSQLCALLVHFAERHQDIVTRNELIDAIWNGNYLSGQAGLTNAIFSIRKLLRTTDLSGNEVIQTVPRKGYRLQLRPVRPLDHQEPDAKGRDSRSKAMGIVSSLLMLAVGLFVGHQVSSDIGSDPSHSQLLASTSLHALELQECQRTSRPSLPADHDGYPPLHGSLAFDQMALTDLVEALTVAPDPGQVGLAQQPTMALAGTALPSAAFSESPMAR